MQIKTIAKSWLPPALIERLKVIVPDVLESRLGHAPRDVSIVINWQELRTVEQTELMVA